MFLRMLLFHRYLTFCHILRTIPVVLYLRLLGQFQACLFFLRKGFERKKAPKPKANDFHSLRSFCASRKIVASVVFCLLNFILLVGFCLWRVFVRAKCFRKKKQKKSRLEIVLITSNTILLTRTPINSPIENLFGQAYDNRQDFFT